jgi:hypothetical protein
VKYNADKSAFPTGDSYGLTKREIFALVAMVTASNPNCADETNARLAVERANALLKELAR